MLRTLMAVALLVTALALPAAAGEPAMKADAAYGVRYAQERVVALPQDEFKPYLTVFGVKNDAQTKEIVNWFETNETLKALKGQSHFRVIYTDDPIYPRFASTMPALPCVRLMSVELDAPVSEFAGAKLPMSADALAKGLNTQAASAECFRRRHQPQPEPQPQPGPYIQPGPQPTPPTPAPPARPRDRMPWFLLGILAVAGAAFGIRKHVKDIYYGNKPKRLP